MVAKQLNFNQPLLSVRRSSSTALPEVDWRKTTIPPASIPPLPYYKSELKSGPVRNPGAIPFQWEHIPGRPKNESKLETKTFERPHAAPKLPPGRLMSDDENPSNEPSKESDGSKSQLEDDGTSVSAGSSLCKKTGKYERSEDARKGNGSSISEGKNSTYLNALDTLSRRKSFVNCSVAGVSGSGDPSMKPFGSFSDPVAQDFMMGRFLPAAKEMALDTPHFASKKQLVAREQPREVPRMRDQVPRLISSVQKIHKKPANSGTFEKTDKAIRDAVYERRRLTGYQRSGMHAEAFHFKYELNKLYPQNDSKKSNEPSKCSSSKRNKMAPYKSVSCHPLIQKEERFSKDSKAITLLKSQRKSNTTSPELLADETAKEEAPLANPIIEKTLYIDSAQTPESQDSNSSLSESRSFRDSRGRTPSVNYSLHDIKDLSCADIMIPSQSRNVDTGDFNMLSSQKMLNRELQIEKTNGFNQVQEHKKHQLDLLPDADIRQLRKEDDNYKGAIMDKNPVLSLPLPKSPSESWLSRALPSVSSRNQKSYLSARSPRFRLSPVDPQWEAVAKSSKLHNDHFRLPALTPISEN